MNKLENYIKKLEKEPINKMLLKEYKRKDQKYQLFLNITCSYVDNLNYFYLSLIDNESNTYLFNKKVDYDRYKNIYSVYSIYDNYSAILKNNYIIKTIDFLDSYNSNIRKINKGVIENEK